MYQVIAQVNINSWWSIAQLAGAGATFVLGPLSWFLWQQHKEDTKYIRDADKNTLNVLNRLTQHLTDNKRDNDAILKEIKTSSDRIIHNIQSMRG